MSRIKYALLGLVIIALAGCGGQPKETAEQLQPAEVEEPALQPDEPMDVTEAIKATPPARKPQPAPARPAREEPMDVTEAIKATPQPNEPESVQRVQQEVEQQPARQVTQSPRITIPAGTEIQVRLQDPLDSSVNQSGDTFRAILDKDIIVNGNIAASKGSLLEGRLSNVSRAGRVEGRATMSLRLVNLYIGDGDPPFPLQTQVLAFEAESTTKEDATKVGIGAGIGAVIGAIAGGGKGAAIGAAVGGGAGGATVLATRGKEVKFEAEQKFIFELTEDVGVR